MLSADLPVVGAGVVADAGVGVVGAVGGPAGGGVVEGDVVEVGLSVEPVSPLSLGSVSYTHLTLPTNREV